MRISEELENKRSRSCILDLVEECLDHASLLELCLRDDRLSCSLCEFFDGSYEDDLVVVENLFRKKNVLSVSTALIVGVWQALVW